jgi:hypothetical protein
MSIEKYETLLLVLRGALLLAAFVGFAWAMLASRRDTTLNFARLSAQHDQALTEIHRLTEKLAEVAAEVRELSLPSPMVSRPAPPPAPFTPPAPNASAAPRGYEMAIRMARGGASIDEIVASCGTTRAEARLLRRLHCAAGAHAA